jgi:hypothetical protein
VRTICIYFAETNKRTIDDVENTEESEAKRAKKVPKQKVVLAIGYEGTNYHGSQSQAHTYDNIHLLTPQCERGKQC